MLWRSWRTALPYVLGNTIAIAVGLAAAYLALSKGNLVPLGLLSPHNGDMPNYYSVARLIISGHASHVYDLNALAPLQHKFSLPSWPSNQAAPYLYPPIFALIIAPLGVLPFTAAFLVWTFVNVVLFVSSLYVLERYMQLSARHAFWARAAACTFLPLIYSFFVGQCGVILLALSVFSLAALRARHEWIAGGLMACTLLKPQYTLALALLLVARRMWRGLAGFTAAAALLALLPLPLVGFSAYRDFFRLAAQDSTWQGKIAPVHYQGWVVITPAYVPKPNQSWAGLVEGIAGKNVPLIGALVAVTLVALVLIALRARDIDEALAAAVLAGLLVSPHAQAYDLTILLLPAAVLIRSAGWPEVTTLAFVIYAGTAVGVAVGYLTPVHPVPIMLAALMLRLTVHSMVRRQRFNLPSRVSNAATVST